MLFYLNLGSFQHLARKRPSILGKFLFFPSPAVLIFTWFVTQSPNHFLSITIIYKYSCSRIFSLFKMEFYHISTNAFQCLDSGDSPDYSLWIRLPFQPSTHKLLSFCPVVVMVVHVTVSVALLTLNFFDIPSIFFSSSCICCFCCL